jgi:hypothetical protein
VSVGLFDRREQLPAPSLSGAVALIASFHRIHENSVHFVGLQIGHADGLVEFRDVGGELVLVVEILRVEPRFDRNSLIAQRIDFAVEAQTGDEEAAENDSRDDQEFFHSDEKLQ